MRILPFMKRKNGIQFAGVGIDSGGGGGSGWKLPDFSQNEQALGVKWVDGKTMYIKTFIGTKGESALYIPLENVDTVIPISATIQSGNNIYTPFYTSTSSFFKFSFDALSGVRRIYVNTPLNNVDYKIVLIYTKVEN